MSKSKKMKNLSKFDLQILVLTFLLLFSLAPEICPAQSGRRVKNESPERTLPKSSSEVKYEGGMIGRNKAVKGTLVFDSKSDQMLFQDKNGDKIFAVPYSSVIAAYGDEKKRTPFIASTIANGVPYGAGLPALLIRRKARYLVFHYKETDTDLQGMVTFKFKEKSEIALRLQNLARAAGLTLRENIYVKLKNPAERRNQ